MSNKIRTRKVRRRTKARLQHGNKAARKHKRKTGRTGSVWKKRTHKSA